MDNSDLFAKCKTSSILADDGNQNESFPVMNSDAKMAVILSKYISHSIWFPFSQWCGMRLWERESHMIRVLCRKAKFVVRKEPRVTWLTCGQSAWSLEYGTLEHIRTSSSVPVSPVNPAATGDRNNIDNHFQSDFSSLVKIENYTGAFQLTGPSGPTGVKKGYWLLAALIFNSSGRSSWKLLLPRI